jgi:glutamate racemase
LTVLKALRAQLPQESTVYLGDTARVPYGTKSAEVVTRYSVKNAEFLKRHDIKLLVVACNTASAVALPELAQTLAIPVVGVIEPGAAAAAGRTRSGKIGVIGTPGTVASGAYQRAVGQRMPGCMVVAKACPLFVPLAEEGWVSGEVPRLVAREYLSDLVMAGIDTLILGCTHYPLLKDAIAEVMGPNVDLVDSALATAEVVTRELDQAGRSRGGQPLHKYFVTDLPDRFIQVAARFLGEQVPHAEQIDLTFT